MFVFLGFPLLTAHPISAWNHRTPEQHRAGNPQRPIVAEADPHPVQGRQVFIARTTT